MKTSKKVLALVLTLVMIFVTVVPSLAAGKDYSKYKVYTVMGDSIPAGYGSLTKNRNKCSYIRVKGSYPDLVAKELGAKLNQMAVTGERTVEIRQLLDDSYKGDAYSGIYNNKIQDLEKDKAKYRKAIKEADVITLGVCSNDVFVTPSKVLRDELRAYTKDFNEQMQVDIEALIESGNSEAAITKMMYYAGEIGVLGVGIPELIKNIVVGFNQFKANLDVITDIIYELNPDVTLMVMGTINPQVQIPIVDGFPITFTKLDFTPFIADYLQYGCKNAYKYHYVETIEAISPYSDYSSLLAYYQSDRDCYDVDHPNAEGHRYIKDQIMNALPETQFIDIDGNSEYASIVKAYNKGYMIGDGGVYFQPNTNVTRAELADVLYRVANKKAVSAERVETWAKKNGILTYDGKPNEAVSGTYLSSVLTKFNKKYGKKLNYTKSYSSTVKRSDLAAVVAKA